MYNYESPHPQSLLHKKEYREEIKKAVEWQLWN